MACRTYKLTKKCSKNYARITHLYYIATENVDAIANPTTDRAATPAVYHTISSDVDLAAGLAAGNKWQKIEFGKLAPASFTDTPVGNADSEYYEAKVVGFYPEQDEEAAAAVNDSFNADVIVLAVRADGKMRLMGSLTQPAHIKFTESTEKGGHDIEVTAHSGSKCPFYDGAVEV
jgi:hypothetical protein